MSTILHLEWTIIPKHPPRPILACSGCGGPKPFRSSRRIRLNANGKRLDAWLIYKCTTCDATWNRPVFERQSVRSLDPTLLDALQTSAPDFVGRLEFDADALRTKAIRIEESEEFEVRRQALCDRADWRRIRIALALPFPAGVRLDRLLAAELGLSRSRLQKLFEAGEIMVEPVRKDALKRGIRDGTTIMLNLRDEAERISVGGRAMGG
ncbi:DUF1062 domain-containing protein [Rhizobium sp. YS-1r]|uniref:DUF1062 domain-containing protein n=1 Tax=Rhizobium sp. YS-1r TaxID=1532558 RepID=UPI0005101180|nr:DUF1062 domain-containing protein [Rhizobium sp. YS-1r]KGD85858.1 hypothetical protein JL39_27075 [Rhizobium sp. YS-1r]